MTGGVGRDLLEDLRERSVRLEAPEPLPTGGRAEERTLSEGDKQDLAENKQQLLKLLHWERKKLEEADRRELVINWTRELGWISLHDPTTGEWHEVPSSGCPPCVVDEAKARRRFGGLRR